MNNKITMQDLFQNPSFANIFPQFNKDDKLQNVYSFSWVDKKIKEYLKQGLNAQIYGDALIINGKKKKVLKEVKTMKWTIEAFFNNLPSITKNIRHNTPLYLPFRNLEEIRKIETAEQKLAVLNIVLDNLNYNPDFGSLNTVKVYNTRLPFLHRQAIWMRGVGYRRKEWEK